MPDREGPSRAPSASGSDGPQQTGPDGLYRLRSLAALQAGVLVRRDSQRDRIEAVVRDRRRERDLAVEHPAQGLADRLGEIARAEADQEERRLRTLREDRLDREPEVVCPRLHVACLDREVAIDSHPAGPAHSSRRSASSSFRRAAAISRPKRLSVAGLQVLVWYPQAMARCRIAADEALRTAPTLTCDRWYPLWSLHATHTLAAAETAGDPRVQFVSAQYEFGLRDYGVPS